MIHIRMKALCAAALLTAAVTTPAAAAGVPADFKRLADNLADAVRQFDDTGALEYAGQIRALGLPLGNEINLIEAEALTRLHKNNAALIPLERYLAGKMREPGRAKALKKELDARGDNANKSWQRRFDDKTYGAFAPFEDGSFYRLRSVSDDLANRNMVVEWYDATSGPLWRMVYGDKVSNHYLNPMISNDGRLITGVRYYGRGWKENEELYWDRLIGVDPMGRLTFEDGHVSLGYIDLYEGRGEFHRDGQGGVITFVRKGPHSHLARIDQTGRILWTVATQATPNPIGKIDFVTVDGAGRTYIMNSINSNHIILKKARKVGRYLDVISSDGGRIRSMPFDGKGVLVGNEAQRGFYPLTIAVSADGSTLFTVEIAPREWTSNGKNFKARDVAVRAYAFPSMRQLWEHNTKIDRSDFWRLDLYPFREGVVFVNAHQTDEDRRARNVLDNRIQRLAGGSGAMMWERKQPYNPKYFTNFGPVDVRPTGIFVKSTEGNTTTLSFLSNTDIAALESDPTSPLPDVDIWPFSEAVGGRAVALKGKFEGQLASAQAAMNQCLQGKAAENGVGVLKTVDADFGFVVIKMNTDFATNRDMSVVLPGGKMAELIYGKAPNKWEISATPKDAASIKAMAPGQVVVAQDGISEDKCPDQKMALDAARAKMADINRALSAAGGN